MRRLHLKRGTALHLFPRDQGAALHERFSVITRQMVSNVLRYDENHRSRSVCFSGHRVLTVAEASMLVKRLDDLLEALYRNGYREFFSGGAIGFDMLAAEAVLRLKAEHADVNLIMAIPCADQALRWSERECQRYERILYCADETIVLSPSYYNGCMMARNRYMVDHSSLCVCYLNKFKGGTVSTVTYAMKEQVPVLNAAMEDACAAYIAAND